MRIGIDIRPLMTAQRTGVGEYSFELLSSIFKIDRDNQYFLYYNSGKNVSANIPNWQYENVKIINSRFPNKIFNVLIKIFGWPKLDKMIEDSSDLDIWFSPNLNFTALSTKTKFILTIHDLSFELFPEFSTAKQFWWHKVVSPKKQCKRTALILTPSENTKKDIINYYNIEPEKIKVIYPGIKKWQIPNTEYVKNKYNLPDNYILFLGAIEPRKNIIGLIQAFEKSNTNATLIITGAPGWKNEKILERAKNTIIKNKIKFLGFIPEEDKPALYAGACVFVYPSFYEGFGFPALEAMSVGTPVVASNRSSLPEITNSAAYLIDPNKPEQIAFAINELVNNQKLRKWHIEKGWQQAQKFNWEKTANEWLKIIKSL